MPRSISETDIRRKLVPPADIVAAAQRKFGPDAQVIPLPNFLVIAGLAKGTMPDVDKVDFGVVTYEKEVVTLDLDENGDPVRGERPVRVRTIFDHEYPCAWWSASQVGRKDLFRGFVKEIEWPTIQKWGCLDHPDAGGTLPAFSERSAASFMLEHIKLMHR